MTPHELIKKLIDIEGPCAKLCCYCPSEDEIREIKECVEQMYKEIYKLQDDKDYVMKKLVTLSSAYYKQTGHFYNWEDENEDRNASD